MSTLNYIKGYTLCERLNVTNPNPKITTNQIQFLIPHLSNRELMKIHNKVCPTFLKTMREKHVNPSNPQTLFRGFEGRRNPAHLLLGFAVKTLISKHILRRIFWIKPMISFHKIPIQKISTIPMRQTNQPTIRLSRNKRSCFPQT
jgi:hypothetical protein